MAISPSKHTWIRVIEQARNGDAADLLDLLLRPYEFDGLGNAVPGAFYGLPDDDELRRSIVSALIFGPWRTANVHTVDKLFTWVFPPGKKPMLSEREVMWADETEKIRRSIKTEDLADALGVTPETLKKRIAKRRSATGPGG